MAKTKGATDLNISKRQEQVAIIMTRLTKEGIRPSVDRIHEEITKTKGYETIVRSTIWEDVKKLNSENTFVKDMAQYNYSKMCEDSYNAYAFIFKEAFDNYKKKWTGTKKIIKQIGKGKRQIELVSTEELAQPKAAFLQIMINAQKAMDDMREGRTVKISVALLQHELGQTKRELQDANQKLQTITQ